MSELKSIHIDDIKVETFFKILNYYPENEYINIGDVEVLKMFYSKPNNSKSPTAVIVHYRYINSYDIERYHIPIDNFNVEFRKTHRSKFIKELLNV